MMSEMVIVIMTTNGDKVRVIIHMDKRYHHSISL